MKSRITLAFLMTVAAQLSFANPTCVGKVSGVSVSASGGIYGSIAGGSNVRLTDVVFCSLNSTEGSYSGEACKGLLSVLLAGSAMNKNATLWFKTDKFSGCTQSWMSLSDMGFYHMRLEP